MHAMCTAEVDRSPTGTWYQYFRDVVLRGRNHSFIGKALCDLMNARIAVLAF